MKKQNLLTWAIFFLSFFLISQFFGKSKLPPELAEPDIGLLATQSEYASGEEVIVRVRNNTKSAIEIPSACPKNPLRVLAQKNGVFEEISAETKMNCSLVPAVAIPAESEKPLSFTYWNTALFGNPGRYRIEFPPAASAAARTAGSAEFTVVPAGFFRQFFRTAFYQPMYNTLILFLDISPGRDLGLAIILLTLAIRLILLVPSQRAIVSQRRMQELQPKLQAIKKKHAGNPERAAAETMQVWKEHKVNPLGSCLPILIQFPVLIALFYVIRSGLNPDNIHFLYAPFKNFDFSNIHTNFLGMLELTRVNVIVLPVLVGVLQFFQLKLAMIRNKSAMSAGDMPSEMEQATKMMNYVMPVMIALFTASVPAGVGLYWMVSTLFAIGQQVVANRKAQG